MQDNKNWTNALFSMPRFAPAIFAAILAGTLLLFNDGLGCRVKKYLIPSLVIYSLLAAVVGAFHRHLGMNCPKNPVFIKNGEKLKFNQISYKTKIGEEFDGEAILTFNYNSEPFIRPGWKILLIFLHILLIGGFLFYNIWNCVLSF